MAPRRHAHDAPGHWWYSWPCWVFDLMMLMGASPAQAVPNRAYIANFEADTVSVVDTTTNTVVGSVAVGDGPQAVAVIPDGTRAYVPSGDDTVSVIDTATDTVVATVGVGALPTGVAITPNGERAYVTNRFSNSVSVIDTSTNTVVATVVGLDDEPWAVAITPDGTKA